MTLADYTLPIPYEQAKSLAVVFSTELANRLVEVQQQYGSQRHAIIAAGPLPDGRMFHSADLVSEYGIGPDGLYSAGFSHLNASRFDEVEVMPMADVMAMIPLPSEV